VIAETFMAGFGDGENGCGCRLKVVMMTTMNMWMTLV